MLFYSLGRFCQVFEIMAEKPKKIEQNRKLTKIQENINFIIESFYHTYCGNTYYILGCRRDFSLRKNA